MPARVQGKIDVHHHVYPPVFTKALEAHGGDPSGWFIPAWTLEANHNLCQAMGVSTAILSVTAPGPDIGQDAQDAQKLARTCNEHNAQIRDAEPQAYGFFATVPSLLNTHAALEEISYALDILKAEGVTLLTRYGSDNHYLGHQDFIPIWDALNARKAVVFIHPTHAVDTNLVNKYLPQPAYDYPHETGRTAVDLIYSNMLRDHASDCKIILSHAGGDLPYLIDRPARLMANAPPAMNTGKTTEEVLAEARSFYFDTALSSSPMPLKALMELLRGDAEDHLLFGTDFPNAPSESIGSFTAQLERQDDFRVEDLRENALKLLPRLRG